MYNSIHIYTVDLEVWSKLAQRARIKRIASKFVRNFDCGWQLVRAVFHSVTDTQEHAFYFRKLSLTLTQKGRFLFLWNVSVHASVIMYRSFYFILHKVNSLVEKSLNLSLLSCCGEYEFVGC